MRFIITGGTGLIGTALTKSLVADSHDVYILSRNPATRTATNGAKLHSWDAKTGDGWSNLITEDTVIVNLAGAGIADKRWSDERKALLLNSRIWAGQAVVDAVNKAKAKPKAILQASAVGYYGTSDDTIITEEKPAGNDFLADLCQQWEGSIQPIIDEGEIRVVIMRTGVVLSRDGGAFPKQLTPFQLFVGGPISDGKQWFPWIHVQDEVAAMRFLAENDDASGVYNLSAPNPVNNMDFTHKMARILQRPGIIPVPAIAFQLLFGEMSTVLLEGQRVVPQNLEEAGFEFNYAELEPALRQLLGKPA